MGDGRGEFCAEGERDMVAVAEKIAHDVKAGNVGVPKSLIDVSAHQSLIDGIFFRQDMPRE